MPFFYEKLLIVAKRETTYGTDATPAGADAVLAFNVEFTPLANNPVERKPAASYFRGVEQMPSGIHTEIKFAVELASAGAAGTAPAFGAAILRACGFAETINAGVDVQYLPISGGYESATLYFNLDGQRHKMLGFRGSVALDFKANQRPMLVISGSGLWATPSATAPPTPDFTAYKLPLIVGATNTPTATLHGTALILRALNIDIGHKVVYRDLVGSESVQIFGRAPKGDIMFEAPSVATKDWFTVAKLGTQAALQIIHGSGAGNICQIDAPKIRVGSARYENEDGAAMLRLDLNVLPNTGDDEIKFTFK